MNTPALLIRTAFYVLIGQVLVIAVMAIALPGGSSLLTEAGFVTPYYERNVLAALHIAAIPYTDPTVFVSVQTAAQMLSVTLISAGAIGIIRSNPWQHGALKDSTPPGRDKTAAAPDSPAPARTGPASGPALGAVAESGIPTAPPAL